MDSNGFAGAGVRRHRVRRPALAGASCMLALSLLITLGGCNSSQSQPPPSQGGMPSSGMPGPSSPSGGSSGSSGSSMPSGGMPGGSSGSQSGSSGRSGSSGGAGMPGLPGSQSGSGMPGGQSGGMPGGQSGSMPGGQSGSMPGGQSGSMPGGQSGSMPGGASGSGSQSGGGSGVPDGGALPSGAGLPGSGGAQPGGDGKGAGASGDGTGADEGWESGVPGGSGDWQTSNQVPGAGNSDIPPMPSERGKPPGSGGDGELDGALEDFDGEILSEREVIRQRANETAGSGSGSGSLPQAGATDPAGSGDAELPSGDPQGIPSNRNLPPAPSPVASAGVPDDIPDAKDDDIIARQLREAAVQETDPELKEKLWDEYRHYKGI